MKVIIVPGMGCTPAKSSNWYSWFQKEVQSRNHECILKDFPDPHACRESRWIPFLEELIGPSKDVLLVGHSSGAACVMRYIEACGKSQAPVKGAILVAAAHTDLGDECERRSEYFSRPWDWDSMKAGAEKIHLFHGVDDHLIPAAEARFISEQLNGSNFRYSELSGVSHFFQPFQNILDVVDVDFAH